MTRPLLHNIVTVEQVPVRVERPKSQYQWWKGLGGETNPGQLVRFPLRDHNPPY